MGHPVNFPKFKKTQASFCTVVPSLDKDKVIFCSRVPRPDSTWCNAIIADFAIFAFLDGYCHPSITRDAFAWVYIYINM